jgi:small subunit ribosomal protein S2
VYETVRARGSILFVGTKDQASSIVAEEAKRCNQFFVNKRWLGGMLTNQSTVSQSIKRLADLEKRMEEIGLSTISASRDSESADMLEDEDDPIAALLRDRLATMRLTKKEILTMRRQREKLHAYLGGIRTMRGLPDLMFVLDTNKEAIAITEARKLVIPVIGVIDSNSDPSMVDFPIVGNDDAARAIRLYCHAIADAALAGQQDALAQYGSDQGETTQSGFDDVFRGGKKSKGPVSKKASKSVGSNDRKRQAVAHTSTGETEHGAGSFAEEAVASVSDGDLMDGTTSA